MFRFLSLFGAVFQPLPSTRPRINPNPASRDTRETPARLLLDDQPRPLGYTFVPYPVELAEMEQAGALPPSQLKILTLRRFANPMTGEWITATKEVAQLAGVDRSTAHKAVRHLEGAQLLHMRHLRSRTVDLVLYYGGFAEPEHQKEGLPPLRWDANFTATVTTPASRTSQSGPVSHTASWPVPGSTKPGYQRSWALGGTAAKDVKNIRKIRNSNNEPISTGGYPQRRYWIPVADFMPEMHDEAVVQELARKMQEDYINNFLELRRRFGLSRLERACALALDKMLDRANPLRGRPGAYVRWLLMNGKC